MMKMQADECFLLIQTTNLDLFAFDECHFTVLEFLAATG